MEHQQATNRPNQDDIHTTPEEVSLAFDPAHPLDQADGQTALERGSALYQEGRYVEQQRHRRFLLLGRPGVSRGHAGRDQSRERSGRWRE